MASKEELLQEFHTQLQSIEKRIREYEEAMRLNAIISPRDVSEEMLELKRCRFEIREFLKNFSKVDLTLREDMNSQSHDLLKRAQRVLMEPKKIISNK